MCFESNTILVYPENMMIKMTMKDTDNDDDDDVFFFFTPQNQGRVPLRCHQQKNTGQSPPHKSQ